ncbi:lysozyme g-like [Neosynchiropus ocellatus]
MRYGDIMEVETSGASQETADQDDLGYCGVDASEEMARADLKRMKKYYDRIEKVGKKHGVDPHLIAGIISRESRAGHTLKNAKGNWDEKKYYRFGWGDWNPRRNAYNAFGLMQVDVNPEGGNHKPKGRWDSETHLNQGTEILVDFICKIQEKFPYWSLEEQLKGGIAAYNMGDGNVHDRNVDRYTTGRDYSNDVVARAQWYKRQRKKEDDGKLAAVATGAVVVGVAVVAVALCGPAGLLTLCC